MSGRDWPRRELIPDDAERLHPELFQLVGSVIRAYIPSDKLRRVVTTKLVSIAADTCCLCLAGPATCSCWTRRTERIDADARRPR